MAALNIPSFYFTGVDQGLQALHLRTQSQQFSPIQQLYSENSSNMSPQVLFPNSRTHKNLSPQFQRAEKKERCNPRISQQIKSNLITLLEGQIHQSFLIDDNPSVSQHNSQSNMRNRLNVSANKQNLAISPCNSHQSLMKINFTVSRHLQQVPFNPFSRRSPLKEFQSKMQDLKNNFIRLKRVVDRLENPEKRCKTLDSRKAEIKLFDQNRINYENIKNSQSTQSGNKLSNFRAKSAKSEEVDSATPNKKSPTVSEFYLAKSVTKSDIDQMSPIINSGDFSFSQRKLNTSEMSSRMVMKKKFNWKSNRATNTV